MGRQYRHVLVDEWQDTNGPQYDLVMELTRAGREEQFAREDAKRVADAGVELAGSGNKKAREGPSGGRAKRAGVKKQEVKMPPPSIFVVGDSDQCIYRFRGADYTNVNRFVSDFEGCETILLRENYRSTANIARAATAVIEKVRGRIKQPTIAVQVRVSVGVVVVVVCVCVCNCVFVFCADTIFLLWLRATRDFCLFACTLFLLFFTCVTY